MAYGRPFGETNGSLDGYTAEGLPHTYFEYRTRLEDEGIGSVTVAENLRARDSSEQYYYLPYKMSRWLSTGEYQEYWAEKKKNSSLYYTQMYPGSVVTLSGIAGNCNHIVPVAVEKKKESEDKVKDLVAYYYARK